MTEETFTMELSITQPDGSTMTAGDIASALKVVPGGADLFLAISGHRYTNAEDASRMCEVLGHFVIDVLTNGHKLH
jgi:hypothetical protein